MEPITSYNEAAAELQLFQEENKKAGVKDMYWFMYPWKGADAKRICGVDAAVELIGFLKDVHSFQNIYVSPETAERLKAKFGIDYSVDEK